ncbi:MAG: hypothetical protein PUB19_10280 [Lachnospiraceae bacterium]|nr:hypothetical protein [Lachnospiraceae bacterium]
MSGYDGEVRIRTNIETRQLNSKMMQLENRMEKMARKAQGLTDGMRKLEQAKVPTEEYKNVSDALHKSNVEFDKLLQKQDSMIAKGKNSGATWDELQRKIESVGADIKASEKYLSQMVQEGTAYQNMKESDKYKKMAVQLRDCNQEMAILQQKHKELAAKQMEQLAKSVKKTSGLFSTLMSRLKGITLSLLVFNWITRGFNAMVSAFKDGVQNMATYSKDFNSRMSEMKSATETLKSSFGTLTAPIVSALTPAIVTLCGWLTNAINAMNKFISAVSGKSTWTRAKKQQVDYAKSLDKTAASAKKASGALASFDDLNVLHKNESSDSGTAAGSSGGGYEEVALTEDDFAWIEKIKKEFETLVPIVIFIGAALATWKVTKLITDLMQISPLLGKIVGWIAIIAGAVLAVVSYFNMWKDGVDWKGLIGYIAGVSLVAGGLYALFGPIAAGIALIIAGIAGVILSVKDMIENGVNLQNTTLLIISALGILIGVFLAFGAPVALVVAAFMAVIGVFIGAMAKAGTLQEWLGYLKNAFGSLGDFIKHVFVGDWKAAFEDIKNIFSNIKNAIIVEFESLINLFIDGLNFMIDKLNALSFDLPKALGGGHVGFDFNHFEHVKFPRLANGGIATSATFAELGEAGREAILPLENNTGWMDDLASKLANKMTAYNGPRNLVLEIDGKRFAQVELPYIQGEKHRLGLAVD